MCDRASPWAAHLGPGRHISAHLARSRRISPGRHISAPGGVGTRPATEARAEGATSRRCRAAARSHGLYPRIEKNRISNRGRNADAMLDGRESRMESRLSRSNPEPRRRTERRENGVHESASRSFESAMRRRRRFRIRAVASAAAVTRHHRRRRRCPRRRRRRLHCRRPHRFRASCPSLPGVRVRGSSCVVRGRELTYSRTEI